MVRSKESVRTDRRDRGGVRLEIHADERNLAPLILYVIESPSCDRKFTILRPEGGMEQISIELRRAKDDPQAHNPQFQEELRAFAQSLRTAGFGYSQRGAVGYSLPSSWSRFLQRLAQPSRSSW